MDCLPSLVLQQICGHIWEGPQRNLYALSLVNSKCYHATVPFIYRKLTIEISTPEKLQQVVTELVDHPLRKQCLIYARQLNVKGKMLRSGLSPEDVLRLHERSKLIEEYRPSKRDVCSADELEPVFNLSFISDHHESQDGENSDAIEKGSPTLWAPLASLITKLQFLVELNYDCVNQFPWTLLKALHQYHPSCRLNLNTFRFHSLNNPEMDPYELELVRSPCLHGLTFRHVIRDSDGYEDYNENAVMDTVTIAPNLKEVRSQYCFPMTTMAIHGRRFAPKETSWKGFIPPFQMEGPPRKGSLTCLSFSWNMPMGKQLQRWSQVTDLSKIKSLALGNIPRTSYLTQVIEMGTFKSLEKLSIHLGLLFEEEHVRHEIEIFFESLEPLKTLRLHRMMDTALVQTILKRHGPSLQELLLQPRPGGLRYDIESMVLASTDISAFAKCCPLLRELHLAIKRSKGDRRETACYEALGEFPSLEKMSIELDCFTPRPDLTSAEMMDPPLDEFDSRVYSSSQGHKMLHVHVRDAFINAAMDEKLARSIWDVVASSQSQNGRLSSLEIAPRRSGIPGSSNSPHAKFRQMSRSFRLTQGGWGRPSDPVNVIEIRRETRELVDKKERAHEAEQILKWGGLRDPNDREEAIMERIWPPKGEFRDWRRDWSSLPLARLNC